jgi:hypothetical protein
MLTGIKAYHSSPHDFERFDLSKIGSGEGAQAYGHGLYFAENPKVSGAGGEYWNQFARRNFMGPDIDPTMVHAVQVLEANKGDRAAALAAMDRILTNKPTGYSPERISAVRDLLASDRQVGPRTYEVNIKADPAQMLDWDKPLDAQPHIADALRGIGYKEARWPYSGMEGLYGGNTVQPLTSGEDVYRSVGVDLVGRNAPPREIRQAATERLRDVGIPGIKYLDEGSRISSPDQIQAIRENIAHREALLAERPGDPTNTKWLAEYQDMLKRAENPTSNYVVFDPANIDILKKYGIAGAAAAPVVGAAMGSTYDQGTYQEPDPMQGTYQ